VERAVRQGEGPAPQTAAVPQRPQQRTLQVSAPSIGKPRRGGDGEITGEKRQGEVGTGQGSWKEKVRDFCIFHSCFCDNDVDFVSPAKPGPAETCTFTF
jgi:hypothetical protein